MSGITVVWTNKDPALLDPGKPITTGLKNKEWDNLDFLRQWVGGSYLAGAVQNHDHDGINSAPIEALPNLIKNGSFERDGGGVPAGWVFTAYTGGSAAIVTASQAHGRACVGVTSTVLANGGGYYESANFFDVGGGEDYLCKLWWWASVADVSAMAEVIWYDATEAQISIDTIWSGSSIGTSAVEKLARMTAPANARLAKLRLTGGVPAVGSAVGTVYFDGVMVPDFPRIEQYAIQNSAVGQSQLKTSSGSVSAYNGIVRSTLPGGYYGFFPNTRYVANSGGGQHGVLMGRWDASMGIAAGVSPTFEDTGASATYGYACYATLFAGALDYTYLQQRYVTGSRPYNLGDGDIGQFVFAIVDAAGVIESIYAAPEAPWHNNGPTDIRADFYDANGKGWRWQDIRETEWVFNSVAQDYVPRIHVVGREQVEITQTIKQADMPLIPHPFLGNDLTGKTVVLLDPVADLTWHLAEMHAQGVSPNELLHDDYLRIDNTALNRAGPPGVMVVPCRWKLT
ncbi:MAG: hypothetical protein AB1450_05070 [Pseudomonadota bacterium]